MTAHHQLCAHGLGLARHLGAQLGPVDRQVGQENAQRGLLAIDEIDDDQIRNLGGVRIDVAAHRVERRHLGKAIEQRQIADVTAVQDGVGPEAGQPLVDGRMGLRMRVRDGHQPQRAVGPERDAHCGLELHVGAQ